MVHSDQRNNEYARTNSDQRNISIPQIELQSSYLPLRLLSVIPISKYSKIFIVNRFGLDHYASCFLPGGDSASNSCSTSRNPRLP
jgi:hypothetical protein